MLLKFLRILNPFHRRLKRRRFWDLKELAERSGKLEEVEDKISQNKRENIHRSAESERDNEANEHTYSGNN